MPGTSYMFLTIRPCRRANPLLSGRVLCASLWVATSSSLPPCLSPRSTTSERPHNVGFVFRCVTCAWTLVPRGARWRVCVRLRVFRLRVGGGRRTRCTYEHAVSPFATGEVDLLRLHKVARFSRRFCSSLLYPRSSDIYRADRLTNENDNARCLAK